MRNLLFTGFFIMITMCTLAQSTDKPSVNKGYYSIGNNNRILAAVDEANLIRDRYVPDPYSISPKGYYSTDVKKNSIPWRKVRGESKTYLVPVVTKGYYSIGRNAEQLKK